MSDRGRAAPAGGLGGLRAPEGVLRGILWMVATTLLMVCVTVIVRHVGTSVPSVQAAFLRYAFGVVLILPMMSALWRRPPSRRSLGIYSLRGLLHGLGVMLWFYAMARVPIAEVTALGYVAPLFVTVGAALFLGEKLHARRLVALGVGIFGAFVILRPGFQEIGLGQLAQLGAGPLFAASFLLAKGLTSRESPAVIVGMLSIFCTLALAPGALLQWQTPDWSQVGWLALTAVFATGGHYTMTRAFAAAPITVTQPVSFLQLVWASVLGIALFGEPVDPFVILGGGIVVAAATFISHREAMAARRPVTPTAAATKL